MTSKTRLALVLLVPALAGLALWFLWGGSSGDAPGAPSAGPTSEASGDTLVGDATPVGDALPTESGERASDAAPEAPRAPTGPPPTGLRVLVTDREGTPLTGVGIRVHPLGRFRDRSLDREGRTGADGVVELLDLEPGATRIHSTLWENLDTEVLPDTVSDVTLVAGSMAPLSGRVVDAAGRGVPDAQVLLMRNPYDDWGALHVATTEADGSFDGIWCGDRQKVFACASRHGPSPAIEVRFASKEDPRAEVELVLGPLGGDLSGTVRSTSGTPLEDVLLVQEPVVEGIFVQDHRSTRTGPDGRFAFPGLAPGTHRLHGASSVHGRATWVVEVRAGGQVQQDLVMPEPSLVRGRVQLPDGTPAVGAEVLTLPPPGTVHDREMGPVLQRRFGPSPVARTGPDGTYELHGIEAGTSHLYASLGSVRGSRVGGRAPRPTFRGSATTVLELAPGAEAVWDPVLDLGGRISGRVVDSSGRPLDGGQVSLDSEELSIQNRNLDDEGRFVFHGLEDRLYQVTLFKPDPAEGVPRPSLLVRPSDLPVELVLEAEAQPFLPSAKVRVEWVDRTSGLELKSFGFRPESPSAWVARSGGYEPLPDGRREYSLTPGSWIPIATSGGALIHEGEPFEVGEGETRDLGTIEVLQPAQVLVEVVTPEGHASPIALEHHPRRDRGVRIEIGSSAERATFRLLPPGRVMLSAQSSGLPAAFVTLDLNPGETRETRIEFRPGVEVHLRCDAEERRLGEILHTEVAVEQGRILGPWGNRHGLRFPWGKPFTVQLAPGDYELRARTDDGQSGTTKFTVGVGPDGEPVAPEGVVEVIAR